MQGRGHDPHETLQPYPIPQRVRREGIATTETKTLETSLHHNVS
jgi:hypothetical protein